MKQIASRLNRVVVLLIVFATAYAALHPPDETSLASETPLNQPDQPAGGFVKTVLSQTNLASAPHPAQVSPASPPTSNQKLTAEKLTCGEIWASTPSGGYAIPDWLYTPTQAADLATDQPYLYLAGKLLQSGLASAPTCPYNGLLATGFASQCGLEQVRPLVTEWQNQFDDTIYRAAVENGVPARLLKNIFAQESQFWLGQSSDNQHFGIGQITEGGLDPLFLAYPELYQKVCTDVLSSDTCQSRYADLSNKNKGLIRGYFLRRVIDASCPDCPKKYDEKKAQESIDIFAKLLIANCEQVGRVIVDITDRKPGTVSTYDDLWRYTMVNYNGGSGCVSGAIEAVRNANEPLDWLHVSARLKGPCKNTIEYVDKVSR